LLRKFAPPKETGKEKGGRKEPYGSLWPSDFLLGGFESSWHVNRHGSSFIAKKGQKKSQRGMRGTKFTGFSLEIYDAYDLVRDLPAELVLSR